MDRDGQFVAEWTQVIGKLTDGMPFGIYLATHEGRVWHSGMFDNDHPLTESEWLWNLGGRSGDSRGWSQAEHCTGSSLLEAAAMQVKDYFAGRQLTFDLPLSLRGTPFQVNVWQKLQRVPFGTTCTYGDLAIQINHPKAARAVGGANRQNNLPVLLPCHRITAAGGKLGGFGGRPRLKVRLLAHEAEVLRRRDIAQTSLTA